MEGMTGRRLTFETRGGTSVQRGLVLADDTSLGLALPLRIEYITDAGDKRIERFHPDEFKGGMHVG